MDLDEEERISPKTKLPELFKLVDKNQKKFIEILKEAVSIASISNCVAHREDVIKMLKFCTDELESLGAVVDVVDGNDESSKHLPPVLFANLFVKEEHKTICVYGNIDVPSPDKTENNEKHSPFALTEKGGRLYGCGISDNKAPLLCWLNALKLYKSSKMEIPVNVKFVIEATSKMHSASLKNAMRNKGEFFGNVEFICLTVDKKVEGPCLKYAYRGLCGFSLSVSCGEKRVHSGTYGGAFNQPLVDAVNVVGSLLDKRGKILVPQFMKDVREMTSEDEKRCEMELCTFATLKHQAGVTLSHKEIPSRVMMHKTRLPSLTVNGFHLRTVGADKDDCASIPNKIEAIFSVRLVPNQTVERTYQQFKNYIDNKWQQFQIANKHKLEMTIGFNPWLEDPESEHYKAAAAAIQTVYNRAPKYVSEGSTLPVVSIFGTFCPASSIIVIPISGYDDGNHSSADSISVSDYCQGIKVIIAYMCEIYELTFK
ncbi:cytosolic non-specific dipeptidase-like [Phymastichus coffea]|uniref:cytosolic non-specific dipeptidase-like n=1 Tax=Phymastichus coffea TaxID=108790 RepID=UPI00273C6162|nr:cytosolic non-specific dipeptidase-like [Phymastichus coffea]